MSQLRSHCATSGSHQALIATFPSGLVNRVGYGEDGEGSKAREQRDTVRMGRVARRVSSGIQ